MTHLLRGRRGEWWVIGQFALFALIVFGPRQLGDFGPVADGLAGPLRLAGGAATAAGLLVVVLAATRLGRALTPLPYPRDDARLVTAGMYRYVRHPIYSGVLLMSVGWAGWVGSLLTLGYVLLLAFWLDRKAAREERWLAERYPDYPAYCRRVRRLVPWVY